MNNSFDDLKDAIASNAFVVGDARTRIINPDQETYTKWIFDFRALLLQPKWLDLYAEIFWERYAATYPFQVCGMESAAISLVAAIVMKGVARGTPVNGLYIRKSRRRYGLMKQIEGTPTSDPIILVDDLINTGKTFDKQIRVLSDAGLKVSEIFVALTFRDKSAYDALGVPIKALFTLEDFNLPLLTTTSPEVAHNAFEVVWKFQAPDPSYNFVVQKSAPAIDDSKMYVGTDAGAFFALDQATGDIVWTFETGKHPPGKGIFSSPALSKGIVYFGAYDGNVYALDAKTGEKRWVYGDADWIGSSPALAPNLNLLFIGLEFGLFRKRGGIAALRMDTGKRVWQQITPALTHGSPLYIKGENMVVIGSNDSTVYAYEAATGTPLWQFRTDGDVRASFAYDQKRRLIFFGTLGGTFYALAHNGVPVFAHEMGGWMYSTPWVDEGVVYFASVDKHIYALSLDTGKEIWSLGTNGRIFASPIIADGSLWCGSNDGRLYEIDPKSGKLKNFFQASERIVNKIAYNPQSKHFFVPTQANEVYCIKRSNE